VDSVDRGAGRGVRIVLMKRDLSDQPGLHEQEKIKMKTRKVVAITKRAVETGAAIPFTSDDLYTVMQKRADKEIDGATAAIRFAKYCEMPDGRVMLQAQKRAAPAASAPPPATAFDRLELERQQHVAKARTAAGDRERQMQGAIEEQIRALMTARPGMTEAAARAQVTRSPKVQNMLASRSIYRDPLAT